VRTRVREVRDAGAVVREDRLATEEPLEVRLAWPGTRATRVGVTMRTPGHDFELAVGMLLAEGLLSPAALSTVAYCTDVQLTREQEFNVVTVTLSQPPPREVSGRAGTVTAAASACGVCGTESIDDVLRLTGVQGRAEPATVPGAVLRSLPGRLRARQRVFDSTGGLHAAALADASGDLLVLREDIGRHNAVDKVVGRLLLDGALPAADRGLFVSGRASFEMVQKAWAAGFEAVVAVSAPSALAVRTAAAGGLTLAGFARAEGLNLYAGPGS
jgi:FdhD protein